MRHKIWSSRLVLLVVMTGPPEPDGTLENYFILESPAIPLGFITGHHPLNSVFACECVPEIF